MRRIGGKPDAYRKQLHRFRENYANALSELRRLGKEQGAQAAEEYCHALKGVTGNIGAHALYEKIAAIDAQLKQGLLPDESTLAETDAQLQQVMREIGSLSEAVPASASAAAPLGKDALHALLSRLDQALEFDLGAAEPLLAELRAGVAGTPMEKEFDALAAQVDSFDIDEARIVLKKLDEALSGTNA